MVKEDNGQDKNNEAELQAIASKIVEIAQHYPSFRYSNFSLSEEIDNIPITPDVFVALLPRTLDSNAIFQFSLARKIDPREILKQVLGLTLPERVRALEGELYRKESNPNLKTLTLEALRMSCTLQKLPLSFLMLSNAKEGDKKPMYLYLHEGVPPSQGLELLQKEAQRRLAELG